MPAYCTYCPYITILFHIEIVSKVIFIIVLVLSCRPGMQFHLKKVQKICIITAAFLGDIEHVNYHSGGRTCVVMEADGVCLSVYGVGGRVKGDVVLRKIRFHSATLEYVCPCFLTVQRVAYLNLIAGCITTHRPCVFRSFISCIT